ncbi:Acetamidase [Colletotrichum orbiculare MAFF 240422]|uniref:Acetamidase n=1 Tax=Colletotrichum orbiculare (strain 104-T / ATCC 96160 / CBS 514.97 / LARS 414 / MAFF 240422) TaxID=1213857 RepID=A0A484FPE4_COLOR|nr:Acetamidase [Colletotrichum orbiculare MAFF 240422]
MTLPTTQKPAAPWQDTVAKKRQAQAEAIAAFASQPRPNSDDTSRSSKVLEITGIADADALALKIAQGDFSSELVVGAYIEKAIESHSKTNCLTEVAFESALRRARELDAHLAKTGTPVGPFHGIPVTLKDQFNVRGLDTTLGYVGRSFSPAVDDAVVVKMLESLGAVIIAKTNLPQSILWCETDNPLWGLTTSPVDEGYTPGGSTGGEAALLATNASLLGWGTDIGGSVRIPSHMNGLYGFKPSSARLPYRGVPVSTEGQEHVPSSIGPMARSLGTIHAATKHLIEGKPWELDARCVPVPWREDLYQGTLSRPLTIGVLFDDNVVRPHPPLTRILRSAVEKLKKAGHEIVDWNADLHEDCIRVMDMFYTVDGGEDVRKDVMAAGEPFIPHVQRLVDRGPAVSVYDYWQLNRRKWELQQAYLDKWKSARSPTTGRGVDVVLTPPMPHAAVPHGSCRWVGYTKVWNFLDYPALVIPGGKVEEGDVGEVWDHEAMGPEDAWNKRLWEENGGEMAALGLPAGLQIVGRKLEEETVLAAGKVVEDALRA